MNNIYILEVLRDSYCEGYDTEVLGVFDNKDLAMACAQAYLEYADGDSFVAAELTVTEWPITTVASLLSEKICADYKVVGKVCKD